MSHLSSLTAAALILSGVNAVAQQTEHPLGQHPAVIVAARGAPAYDYTTKFYRHPAGLALAAEAPHENADHPAVQVARRGNVGIDPNTWLVRHPASPTTRGDNSAHTSLAAAVSSTAQQ
jgi:hypothetical protein